MGGRVRGTCGSNNEEKDCRTVGEWQGLTADYGCSSCCSFGVLRDIKVAIVLLFLDKVVFMVVIMFLW